MSASDPRLTELDDIAGPSTNTAVSPDDIAGVEDTPSEKQPSLDELLLGAEPPVANPPTEKPFNWDDKTTPITKRASGLYAAEPPVASEVDEEPKFDWTNAKPIGEGNYKSRTWGMSEYLQYKYAKGEAQLVRGAYGWSAIIGKMKIPEARAKGDKEMLEVQEKYGTLEDVHFSSAPVQAILGEAAEMVPMLVSGGMDSIEGMAYGAMGGAIVGGITPVVGGQLGPQAASLEEVVTVPAGVVAGMAFGMKVGGSLAIINNSMQIEGGNMYLDLTEAGIDEDVAKPIAIVNGAIVGVLEVVQFGKLTNPVRKQMVKIFKKKVFKDTLVEIALGQLKNIGEEVLIEDVQYLLEAGLTNLAAQIDDDNKAGRTIAQIWEELQETTYKSAMGMSVLTLPGPAIQTTALGVGKFSKVKHVLNMMGQVKEKIKQQKAKGTRPTLMTTRKQAEAYGNRIAKEPSARAILDVEQEMVKAEFDELMFEKEKLTAADQKRMRELRDQYNLMQYARRIADAKEAASTIRVQPNETKEAYIERVEQSEYSDEIAEALEKEGAKTPEAFYEAAKQKELDDYADATEKTTKEVPPYPEAEDIPTPRQAEQKSEAIAGAVRNLDAATDAIDAQMDLIEDRLENDESLTKRDAGKLRTKLKNLFEKREQLDDERANLLITAPEQLSSHDMKGLDATVKATTLEKLENKILENGIKRWRQAFKRGKAAAKREAAAISKYLKHWINQSGMTDAQKSRMKDGITSIDTVDKLDRKLPSIRAAIKSKQEKGKRKAAQAQIKKLLKNAKAKKQAGKPVGRVGADANKTLNSLREVQKVADEAARVEREAKKIQKQVEKEEITQEEADKQIAELRKASGFPQQKLLDVMKKAFDAIQENPEDIDAILTYRMAQHLADMGSGNASLDFAASLADYIAMERNMLEAELEAQREKITKAQGKTVEIVTGGVGMSPAKSQGRGPNYGSLSRSVQFRKWLKGWSKGNASWGELMDIISYNDTTSKSYKSWISKFAAVAKAKNREKSGRMKNMKKIKQLFIDAFELVNPKELLTKLQEDSVVNIRMSFKDTKGNLLLIEMSKGQLRKRWMELQDPTLEQTFRETMGYTDEVIEAINKKMTEKDIKVALAQLQFYREYYNEVNEVYRAMYHVDLPFNEFYSPIARDVETAGMEPVNALLQEIDLRTNWIPGSIKSRVRSKAAINAQNDFHVLMKHVMEMEHFMGWAEKIRDLKAVFSNKEVIDAIRQEFGDDVNGVIKRFINDMQATHIARMETYKILEKYRLQYIQAKVMISPAQIPKQMISMVAAWEYVPTKFFVKHSVGFWAHPIKNAKFLMDSSILMLDRDFANFTRDLRMIQESDEFQAYRANPTVRNQLMLNVRFGDRLGIVMGGWSVYQHAITPKKEGGLGMTHEQAITERFEPYVETSQQSGDIDQLGEHQRGGSISRLYTAFKNTVMQQVRKLEGARRGLASGRMPLSQATKIILIHQVIIPQIFMFVSNGFAWDEDEQEKALIMGPMSGIYILGDALEAIAATITGAKYFANEDFVSSSLGATANALRILQKDEITHEDWDKVATATLGGLVDPLTGVGTKRIKGMVEGIVDIANGDTIIGSKKALGWPPYTIESLEEKKDDDEDNRPPWTLRK